MTADPGGDPEGGEASRMPLTLDGRDVTCCLAPAEDSLSSTLLVLLLPWNFSGGVL